MLRARTFGPALVLALAWLSAAPARAQIVHDDNLRISGHLALGAAGNVRLITETSVATLDTESDLDPTVGFGLRIEKPLFDFLSIGAMVQALTIEPDVVDSDREWAFDFDLLVRARVPLEVIRHTLVLEPYVAVPVGFSFGWLDDPDGDGNEAWPGWNISTLAGIAVLHASGFGGFFEIGWRHLEVYTHVDTALVDVDASLIVNELALNLGLSYLF